MRALHMCANFAAVVDLTEALDANGVQQIVLTTRSPRTAPTEPFGDLSCVVRVGAPISATRHVYGLLALPRLHSLVRAVQVVHAHNPDNLAVLQAASLASTIGGVPLVVSVDTATHRRGQRRALSRADAVIASSHQVADELEVNGVEPERLYVPAADIDLASWVCAVYQDVWSRAYLIDSPVAVRAAT